MTSRLALATTVAAIVLGNTAGASAQTYEVTKLVPGSAFHGVHGLGIDKSGRLFAGSVAGAALYEVDRSNGTAKIAVPSPEGMVMTSFEKERDRLDTQMNNRGSAARVSEAAGAAPQTRQVSR